MGNLQDRNKVSIPSQWSIYQSALLYCSRLCFLHRYSKGRADSEAGWLIDISTLTHGCQLWVVTEKIRLQLQVTDSEKICYTS